METASNTGGTMGDVSRRLLILVVVGAVSVGCGNAHAGVSARDPVNRGPSGVVSGRFDDRQAPGDIVSSAEPAGQTPPQPTSESVQFAMADLGRRLGMDPSAITLLAVEDVTWSDSSLGCPESGMAYMQVLTPGQRIQLGADGQVYEYHGGRTGMPRYCERPEPPISDGARRDGPLLVPEPIIVPADPTKSFAQP
jgi:hypothetical protein